jgi:hypothetical protein
MKPKFIPNSPHERHQKYFDAFLIEEGLTNSKYLGYITQYIFDPAMSPDNEDDLEFFKNLLFESMKGKVHIDYYDQVVTKWVKFAFNQTIETLARYAYFLGRLSDMFLKDFYNYLLKFDDKEILIHLFPKLDSQSKVHFIEWADDYPEIVESIPKLKMYLLFT